MRSVLVGVLSLCLSLWLGGLVALVIFVSSLFHFDRAIAIGAAPILFHVFERYQIGLAALTVLLLVAWQAFFPSAGGSKLKIAAIIAAVLAAALAAVQIGWITPTITASRGVDPAKFDRFHHLASQNYSAITLFVAIAGLCCLLTARPKKAPPTV